MSNYLVFKAMETKSIDSVETDLPNYEISQEYTNFKEISAVIANTSGTLDLGTPETLPSTTPFIVIISDQPVNLSYKTTGAAVVDTDISIYYLAGNKKGYDFALANTGAIDANIIFRAYW